MNYIYFDNAATTKINEDVLNDMINFENINFANSSSTHKLGIKVKSEINKARRNIANSINADENEIYFTSGATESNNLAILGIINNSKKKIKHIITSKIEHSSILNICKNLENRDDIQISYLDVDENGIIPIDEIKKNINENTILISIMFVNNEIGTIQNIKEIGELAKKYNIYFHSDAVAGYLKLDINVKNFNIDLMSISSHKIYGPKGIGAIFIKKNTKINPIIFGGNQEFNLRAGTLNSMGIIGFSSAVTKFINEKDKILNNEKILNEYLIKHLNSNNNIILNSNKFSINNIINFSIKNKDINKLALILDLNNICVSLGSACNAGVNKISDVIKNIYIDKYDKNKNKIILNDCEINGAIRISISYKNTIDEINKFLKILNDFTK